jgi:3-hydroxyisobutyrate dehydrogenase
MSELKRVGFIGLGDMGAPMARNLVKAGYPVVVHDRRRDAVQELVGQGAHPASSVAELAGQVDVVCTCVLYDHQVKEIFLADDGILSNAKPGLIATIHSTVPPETIDQIEKIAHSQGVSIVDAPVSGASTGSRAGTLTLMVGATPETLRQIAPVLEVFAGRVIHVGRPGMGQVVKLGNNIMALGNQLIAMEAVALVEAFGISRQTLFEVAEVSTGASWAAANYGHFDRYGTEHTLAGTPELPHRLGKDLRYALSIAQQRWTYLPLVALASQLLPEMFRHRWQAIADAAAPEFPSDQTE